MKDLKSTLRPVELKSSFVLVVAWEGFESKACLVEPEMELAAQEELVLVRLNKRRIHELGLPN